MSGGLLEVAVLHAQDVPGAQEGGADRLALVARQAAQRVEDVTESGTAVAQAAGVKVVGMRQPAKENTGFPRAILEVGSGQYRLQSTLPKTSS